MAYIYGERKQFRGLKGAGISYKEFAEKTGISLD